MSVSWRVARLLALPQLASAEANGHQRGRIGSSRRTVCQIERSRRRLSIALDCAGRCEWPIAVHRDCSRSLLMLYSLHATPARPSRGTAPQASAHAQRMASYGGRCLRSLVAFWLAFESCLEISSRSPTVRRRGEAGGEENSRKRASAHGATQRCRRGSARSKRDSSHSGRCASAQ